jgi:uncharacterized protein (DUF2384 family)
MEIYRAVRNGFPLQSVLNMIENSEVYKQRGVLSKIVGASDRTLARRLKTPNEILTSEQSTRALNYAEVLEKPRRCWARASWPSNGWSNLRVAWTVKYPSI